MTKQIYVNIPVSNLEKSTAFYDALGFTKNPTFSDENASCMTWSDDIVVMLLVHDFYKKFLDGKDIADTTKTNSVLLAISFDTKDAVQEFADIAKQNGGNFYQVDMGTPAEMMFSLEVCDPDGNTWEPMWMDPNFVPHEN
jgi:predicted lactoylglutathione lyase